MTTSFAAEFAAAVAEAQFIGASGERSNRFQQVGSWVHEAIDLDVPPPPREWLLRQRPSGCGTPGPGMLPLGKTGLLVAPGGTGKSNALCQLAVSVASGRDWMGFDVATPGAVVLALAEEDLAEVHRRLHHAVKVLKLTNEQKALVRKRVLVLPLEATNVALTDDEVRGNAAPASALIELRQFLDSREVEWKLMVLDPLSRFAGSETEVSNAAATRWVQTIESLTALRGGPTVVVAHHATKSSRATGKPEERGVTAIRDGFRWAMTMSAERVPYRATELERLTLSHVKSNYSLRAPDVHLKRDSAHGGALAVMTDAEVAAFDQAKEDAKEDKKTSKAKRGGRANGNGAGAGAGAGNGQDSFNIVMERRSDDHDL
jgi:RecA-family ATPase